MGVNLTHIESRPSKDKPGEQYDFFVDCEVSKETMKELLAQLKPIVVTISIHSRSPDQNEG